MDSVRGHRVSRSRGFRTATVLATSACLLSLIAVPFTNHAEQATPLALAGIFFHLVIGCGAGWLGWVAPKRTPVSLAVRGGGLSIDGTVAKQWTSGEAVALPDGSAQIDLGAGLRRERIEVRDLETARALLAALGLDRRAGTSQFYPRVRVRSAAFVLAAALAVVGVSSFAFMGAFMALFFLGLSAIATLAGVFQWFRSSVEMTVGQDGLEIRRGWERTFVPYARVQRVFRVGNDEAPWNASDPNVSIGFRITLADGTSTVYDTRAERFRGNVWRTDPIFDAVTKAWEEARTRTHQEPAAHTAAVALARGTQSSHEWITSLRAQGRSERADYRVAALDSRALFDVLVDPSATREVRAAAAVALAASEEHAPRLRVAADDVADDVVRRVAIAAAEEDDAELAEALEMAAGPRVRPRAKP